MGNQLEWLLVSSRCHLGGLCARNGGNSGVIIDGYWCLLGVTLGVCVQDMGETLELLLRVTGVFMVSPWGSVCKTWGKLWSYY